MVKTRHLKETRGELFYIFVTICTSFMLHIYRMGPKSVMKACPRHPIAIGCTREDTMINLSEYTIIVKCQPIVTLENFMKAIIACYYTFNIQYPKEVGNMLLCIEKYCIAGNFQR